MKNSTQLVRVQTWKRICSLADIPRLGARVVTSRTQGNIAVFRSEDDRVFALLDRCPHQGGPLSEGIVFGRSVSCPLHGWTIGLENGCANAPDEGCAKRYEVRIEDGSVLLNDD